MPTYVYSARQQGRLVEGMLDAASLDQVVLQLTESGATPVTIEEHDTAIAAPPVSTGTRRRIGLDEQILLARQLRSLSRAGVPIARSMQGLADSVENDALRGVLRDVVQSLQAGTDLATSLRRHSDVFSALFVSVVHVGENTGRLDLAFEQIAGYLELEKETRRRFRAATRYPLFVVGAIVVALAVINLLVIPALAGAFEKYGADLPWQTEVLLSVSSFSVSYWYLLLGGALGAAALFRAWLGTPEGRLSWDRAKLRFPLIGPIFDRINLGRFCHTFAMVLEAGVPVNQGLAIVAHAIGNAYLDARIMDMRAGIERGDSISRTASLSGLFSPVVLQMIAIGEETGRMEELLREAAEFYEEDVDYRLKSLAEAIEPIVMVVIGGLVLMLALGVFLPLWDLSSIALR